MKWFKRLLGRPKYTTYKWYTSPEHAARLQRELALEAAEARNKYLLFGPRLSGGLTATAPSYASFVKVGNFTKGERDSKFLAGLGLAGEAGEVVDIIKKHLLHDKPLDRDHLTEELGDVLWYLVHTMNVFGFTYEGVRDANIAKLCKRYPDQYGDPSDWLTREKEDDT